MLKRTGRKIHLIAACLFSILTLLAFRGENSASVAWRFFGYLSGSAALLAWLLYGIARVREKKQEGDLCRPENQPNFPEGQARLIDSGRLPNAYNPRVDLRDFETCHFTVFAKRLIFTPLPERLSIDPTRLAVRYSGNQYYYIVRPQEVLMPAQVDQVISGELVITNQRILFIADHDAFEVPLQSLKLLDCSAHLVDFHVRNRRYTVQTEAACYAEKVLMMLLQIKT